MLTNCNAHFPNASLYALLPTSSITLNDSFGRGIIGEKFHTGLVGKLIVMVGKASLQENCWSDNYEIGIISK